MTDAIADIIEVAVPLPLDRTFRYRVPDHLLDRALPGRRVFIPFGHRRITGYIIVRSAQPADASLKQVIEVLDDEPLWTEGELEFFQWIASYYLHPLGEVLKAALPAGINIQERKSAAGTLTVGGRPVRREACYRRTGMPLEHLPGKKAAAILQVITEMPGISGPELNRRFGSCSPQLKRLAALGLVALEEREVFRDPFRDEEVAGDSPLGLNSHQAQAFDALRCAADSGVFSPYLLHGITGSGKTEVYLQAIAHVLGQGRNALVLVPEISLTPQLVRRFRARFGTGGIAILHSALSDGERYDEWRRIRRGQVRIVIGARSALFAPLERIGIIVVDEEHEASFKQAEGLRYNARDLSLVRGRMEQAVVVLGSATPQVTTLYAARQGRLRLLTLPERAAGASLPDVAVVNMQGEKATVSPALADALTATVAAGGQAMVFLNRRGFATFLVCTRCSAPLSCPNCSVTLTWHRQAARSVCHYCDYSVPAPCVCPSCGSLEMRDLGAGTERLEHDLAELLPGARLVRMDSDTTAGRGSHARILARMAEHRADILVGTQMITKGHDFPGVTQVGVINAEASLHMPDFRSAERTFQVLSQVIGRAGRGDTPGRVLVQTLNPDHYAIRCAVSHDLEGFLQQELEFRREAGYPPFSFLASLNFSGTAERQVAERAEAAAEGLMRAKAELGVRVEVLGPTQAPLYRLRGRFRRRILLKAPVRNDLRRLLTAWCAAAVPDRGVREVIDIDPVDMM